MKYIASCSFGKDSLAMVLLLLEQKCPLDEVIFYDTGMEFQAIYSNRDQLIPILNRHGVKFVQLSPTIPFIDKMFKITVYNRDGSGFHNGYSWCGGRCRWGTTDKNKVIQEYLSRYNGQVKEYIGIAFDEQNRIKDKIYPLVEHKMKEADCLKFCRDRGWNWLEGDVDLYNILDRVSCWCCANKNRKELFNMYRYLPSYWERLKDIQSQTDRPMKNFCNRKYGSYGNVFDMEKVFEKETTPPKEVSG